MDGNGKLKGIDQRTHGDIALVKVGGYIEFNTSDELDRVLDGLVERGQYKIILDLSSVEYISSRGWSIFLSKIKVIREHEGDLKLVGLTENVYEVFKVLEFFWFMKTYPTLDEALSDFEHGVPPMPEDGQPTDM